jgi:hypothetical protein
MRRSRILLLLAGLLLGCGHPVEISVPPPAPVTEPQGPMLDDAPQGVAPSFYR